MKIQIWIPLMNNHGYSYGERTLTTATNEHLDMCVDIIVVVILALISRQLKGNTILQKCQHRPLRTTADVQNVGLWKLQTNRLMPSLVLFLFMPCTSKWVSGEMDSSVLISLCPCVSSDKHSSVFSYIICKKIVCWNGHYRPL